MSKVVVNSLPFATRLRASRGAREILERDRKRAAKFLAGLSPHGPGRANFVRRVAANTGMACDDSIDATDTSVTYTASVGVGNPPTIYNLLIDTGSSNTWVGANTPYIPTITSKNTGNTVNVGYGIGKMSGEEYTDTVTLSKELVIQNQSIGVASSTQDFSDVDGILGVGPADLTRGTISNTPEVPTVTDNLYSQGKINTASLGVFFEPSSQTNVANGEVTFGGADHTKFDGPLHYVPITSTSPASSYWGIDQSVTYGKDITLTSTTAGIVDTGTTLILLATEAFQAYQQATGATMDQATGLLTITEEQYQQLQNMYFHIGDVEYKLTPDAQIWPRALNSAIGGQDDQVYLITSDLGNPSGSGLDFINGFSFLQRFYSVYDTSNQRVGLAKTQYTYAEIN